MGFVSTMIFAAVSSPSVAFRTATQEQSSVDQQLAASPAVDPMSLKFAEETQTLTQGSGCSNLYRGRSGQRETVLLNRMSYSGVEAAQFMAQCAHECAGFATMVEYSSGSQYENRTDLGNTQPGDGPRYKGRGYIQITGRYNYRTFGRYVGEDLENNPSLAADTAIAAKVAVQYWNRRVKPYVSNFSDTVAVTRRINGGTNGLQDRINKFNSYKTRCP